MKRRMMRRPQHSVPGLNTASLPDLIFTVLFFFMLVTHMRDVELKVRYEVPQGTELEKLTHKSAVSFVYIGTPMGTRDTTMLLQLNDKIADVAQVQQYVEDERNHMSAEDQGRMTVSIKADRKAPLGIVADVKQALQQAGALKINYSATDSNQ